MEASEIARELRLHIQALEGQSVVPVELQRHFNDLVRLAQEAADLLDPADPEEGEVFYKRSSDSFKP